MPRNGASPVDATAAQQHLALAAGAVAEAKGLLRQSLAAKSIALAKADEAGAAALEQSLARMVNSIEASLDIACDAANKIGSRGNSAVVAPAPDGAPETARR